MPYLALVLFLPWFLLIGALFRLFPRQPRDAARKRFDLAALAIAFVLSFVGMQWGYALGLADVGTGAIWKQVLATLVAYGHVHRCGPAHLVAAASRDVGAPLGRELLGYSRSDRRARAHGRSYESRIVQGRRAR